MKAVTTSKKPDFKYLIGIDEVGRGPLAGPVAVGAFVFLTPKSKNVFRGVKESKQLTAEQRNLWFTKIQKFQKEGHINFSVSFRSEKIIDDKGLTFAIKDAMVECLKTLDIDPLKATVVLDGGLKAPIQYVDQKTIIRGDAKRVVIALASICAKVLRDEKMIKLSKKHPNYGFNEHKGYGTKKHYEAIKLYGILPVHRKRFLKNMLNASSLK